MRISTGNFNRVMLQVMQQTMTDLAKTSDQLSTGKRILQPSDDAIDTVKILHLNNELTAIGQFENNISSVTGWLQQQDALYSGMNDLLLRARDLLLQASNGTQSNADLKSFATELGSLNESLLSLANYQTADGQYLFSGTTTNQQPVVQSVGDYAYNGNNQYRQVAISGSAQVQITQPGNELFFDNSATPPLDSIFDALTTAVSELNNPVNLPTVLADTIVWVDATMERIGSAQTRSGSDLNLVDRVSESHADIRLFAEQLKSGIENIDMVEATTRLNQQQLILSASQQVYASIKRLSLFNYFA
ncbi:flagellar hook-associated protein FlgL [Endozoicomonas sp. SCSIO W0465]|uniref:flagellar hook-associated protein FlgL n=1 Tax=Endozoicomonas sp. SCSIO W0465 TaxID=2918516 RepID=UPI0021110FDE|nr:flagellar hook-associated protein FlgL [Endozoicomonas sp. SCSIO W0465]